MPLRQRILFQLYSNVIRYCRNSPSFWRCRTETEWVKIRKSEHSCTKRRPYISTGV